MRVSTGVLPGEFIDDRDIKIRKVCHRQVRGIGVAVMIN